MTLETMVDVKMLLKFWYFFFSEKSLRSLDDYLHNVETFLAFDHVLMSLIILDVELFSDLLASENNNAQLQQWSNQLKRLPIYLWRLAWYHDLKQIKKEMRGVIYHKKLKKIVAHDKIGFLWLTFLHVSLKSRKNFEVVKIYPFNLVL